MVLLEKLRMEYYHRVIELKCKELSKSILSSIKEETKLFIQKENRAPGLAVILVGNNSASKSYVKSKTKRAEELGFVHFQYSLSEDSLESDVLSLIDDLNNDDRIDGILVQLPLPKTINPDKVIARINPEKDVDGFTPTSLGLLALNRPSFVPCTPLGIVEIFKNFNIETKGKRVCIIGRSNIVGKPLMMLLSNPGFDATVTLCNSHTTNLKEITLSSDIVVIAIGKAMMIDSSFVKDGAVVIDVGINRVEDKNSEKGYVIKGDADYSSFENRDVSITPVPGGVGVMTVTMLMANTLNSAKRRLSK